MLVSCVLPRCSVRVPDFVLFYSEGLSLLCLIRFSCVLLQCVIPLSLPAYYDFSFTSFFQFRFILVPVLATSVVLSLSVLSPHVNQSSPLTSMSVPAFRSFFSHHHTRLLLQLRHTFTGERKMSLRTCLLNKLLWCS